MGPKLKSCGTSYFCQKLKQEPNEEKDLLLLYLLNYFLYYLPINYFTNFLQEKGKIGSFWLDLQISSLKYQLRAQNVQQ